MARLSPAVSMMTRSSCRDGRRVLSRWARTARTTTGRSPTVWSSATRCGVPGIMPASASGPARRCARRRWIRLRAGGSSARRHGLRPREAAGPADRRRAVRRRHRRVGRHRRRRRAQGWRRPTCCAAKGYDGPLDDDQRRRRAAVRSAEPVEGLPGRARRRKTGFRCGRRSSTPSSASICCSTRA